MLFINPGNEPFPTLYSILVSQYFSLKSDITEYAYKIRRNKENFLRHVSWLLLELLIIVVLWFIAIVLIANALRGTNI